MTIKCITKIAEAHSFPVLYPTLDSMFYSISHRRGNVLFIFLFSHRFQCLVYEGLSRRMCAQFQSPSSLFAPLYDRLYPAT